MIPIKHTHADKDHSDAKNRLIALIGTTLTLIIVGVFVFHRIEHLSWLDSYYFSVITLTTIGYGDISPVTPVGKIFTTIYSLIGIGIFVAFISELSEYFVERRQIRREKRRIKKEKKELN